MNKELFNFFVFLFPFTGIMGGLFHYAMALYFITTQPPLADPFNPFPKWFKITFIANVLVTSISGLILIIF